MVVAWESRSRGRPKPIEALSTCRFCSTPTTSPMRFRTPLPQELVDEFIDKVSGNADVKACSLVSRSWAHPARKRLFHHVRICPGSFRDWLSRPPESVQRMASYIVKVELSDHWVRTPSPPFRWEDPVDLLTRLISSLALSPVQWLKIGSFSVGGFDKTTLEQCFEPICHSIHSLILDNLMACPDATRYFISLFPNLDNLHIDGVSPTSMARPAPEWAGCGIKHSPRLSGTLQFSSGRIGSELFASIASLSPRFRVIFPGGITSSNWGAMRGLMGACAETVEMVSVVWWESRLGMHCGLRWYIYILLTTPATDPTPTDLFSSCKRLRRVGLAAWGQYRRAEVHETLSTITSKHLSAISLQLAPSDRSLPNENQEEFRQWWQNLENVLCHLADRCLGNGQAPLVLDIIWRRSAGHKGDCGVTYPDTILPKFREKGLIRFNEGNHSDCWHCADILADGSQTSGGT